VPTGAWLLIGVGSALVIFTLLLVFIIPSGRPGPPSGVPKRRLVRPRFRIPFASPAGSMIKGFSYLYAPLRYRQVNYSVAGRLERAIARVDAVDPTVADERIGQALHQSVDLISGPDDSLGQPEGGELAIDVLDQPRSEEPR
jgi:hypothetical protein